MPDAQLTPRAPYRDHIAHVYRTDVELVDYLSEYVVAGLKRGEAVVVIATAGHRSALEERLLLAGFDLAGTIKEGTYLPIDAREVVIDVVGPDGPDLRRFLNLVAPLVARAGQDGRRFRIFGEAVCLVVDDGREDAALAMEALWNGILGHAPFPLLCAYASDSLRGPHGARIASGIRASHGVTVEASR